MTTKQQITCPKCNGHKTILGYSHIANGLCFRCAGSGFVWVTKSQIKAKTKKQEEKAKTQAFYIEELDKLIKHYNLQNEDKDVRAVLAFAAYSRDASDTVPACKHPWAVKDRAYYQKYRV